MLAVMVICICFVTACGSSALGNNPAKELTAIGNGGMGVVKGDYLYFVNGYQDYKELTDVTKDNKFGSITRGGIYRTKLVDGKVARDEDGFLVDVECVVPQTVGYDKGGFYIVGDYIYYLTCHMENVRKQDGTKELKNNWSDVCRINIDGTNQKRLAYTTSDDRVSDWAVYTIDGNDYVVLVDGDSIIAVDGNSGKVKTMATGVESVVLPKQANYTFGQTSLTGNEKYIYYTREYAEGDQQYGGNGNMICKVAVNSDSEILVACDGENDYEILDYINASIYYSKVRDDSNTEWAKNIYRRRIDADATEIFVCPEYTSYVFINNNDNASIENKVVAIDENNYIYLIYNNSRKVIYKESSSITFIGEDNGKVYYIANGAIYTLSYAVEGAEPVLITNNDKTYKLDVANLIDLDGRRLFVMAEYTASNGDTNYYLNIIDSYDKNTDSDFVGKFADGETPAEPEEVENEDGEMEKPQWVI